MRTTLVIPNIDLILERYEYRSGEIFDLKRMKFLHKAKTSNGYFRVPINCHYFPMHRIVFAICHKISKFDFLDHVNGDRKDNRIENLREANFNENTWNKKLSSNNRIGVKGIRKIGNSFQARIMYSGNSLTKSFYSIEEAIEWLGEKRKSLHMAFANDGIHKEI